MRLLVALLVGAVAASPAGASGPRVVGCSTHVEAGGPRPTARELRAARRSSVTVANLTLWGMRLAAGKDFRPGPWKAGVTVRDYRSVTVRVARRDRAWVGLDYVQARDARRVADADPAVRFEPCPPGTRSFTHHDRLLGPETTWAGDFVVSRRGCATLFVRREAAARSVRVRIGFGARCQAGGGKASASSRTSPRMRSSAASSSQRAASMPSSTQRARSLMCSTPSPRVVIAGVPRRMPDGSIGLRVSNGTAL